MTKRKTVSEVCRELGVSETSFARWREKALAAMEDARGDKPDRSGREARLGRARRDPAGVGRGDAGERAAGKSVAGVDVRTRAALARTWCEQGLAPVTVIAHAMRVHNAYASRR